MSNTQIRGRIRRHLRVRGRIFGTAKRPRLSVFRSNTRVSLQLIDDERGITLVASDSDTTGNRVQNSFTAGKKLAELAVGRGVAHVVFDRGGYKYHGRVKAVAEGAREGGLIL